MIPTHVTLQIPFQIIKLSTSKEEFFTFQTSRPSSRAGARVGGNSLDPIKVTFATFLSEEGKFFT